MADDQFSPDEIEDLLNQARSEDSDESDLSPPASDAGATAPRAATPQTAAKSSTGKSPQAARRSADDIQLLLNQAEQAIKSVENPVSSPTSGLRPFQLQDFAGTPASTEKATLELIQDVDLDLRIELGRTQMYLEDVLKLRRGSVVPLDKLAGDPVDVYVNGRLIARGEILVMNDNFCVRIAELIAGDERGA